MADGKIVVKTELDAKDAQKKLDALTAKIEKMEANLQKSTGEQSGIKAQLDAAKESAKQTEAAIKSLSSESERLKQITSGNVAASPAEYTTAYTRQAEVAAQLKEQEALLRQQDKAVENLDGKYAKITDKVIEQTSALNAAKEKAGEYAEQITHAGGASERMEAAAKSVSDSMNRFSKRIGNLFRRVLVFSLITKALQSLKTWLSKTVMQNEEARAAFARLKGALLTLAQPILQVVIPVFVKLVNILTQVVTAIAKFVGMLSGKSWASQKTAAKALNDEQKALSGVGSAADEASKSLAGFDEINQLSDNKASGGGGDGASSTEIAPDFTNLDIAEDKLKDILGIVGAIAAGLLAWKIASMFTNSLSKLGGIALSVAGAFAMIYFYIDAWNNGIDMTNLIGMVAGLAALIGGLALAFGPVAAGIASVTGGIALLVVGIKDLIENGKTLENTLTIVAGILAAGIGISLLVGGWIPAAIAAVVALITFVVLQWDAVKAFFVDLWENIKEIFSSAWDWICGIWESVATWFDENVIQPIEEFFAPITEFIGKIFEGAWLIVQAVWKIVSEWFNENVIQPIVNFFKPIVETVGGFFRDLWDGIKKIWKDVSDWFSEYVIDPITKAWETALEGIKNFAKGIFNGILGFFETIVNGLIDALNWLLSGFNAAATWAGKVIGKDWSGIGTVQHVSIPRLATGAVIPPNREFMAVLGDQKSGNNIEAPESLIRKIVREETGGSSRLEALLETLIDIAREGKTLELDGVAFAKVAKRSLNNNSRAYGVPVRG